MSRNTASAGPQATLDDLARVEGKAELIGGRIVPLSPTGSLPGLAAKAILLSLSHYEQGAGNGTAYGDSIGFVVPNLPSGRQSFSPDAAYLLGPTPRVIGFIHAAPEFAVEVRSENDYGRAAERRMAEKRADYFAAGTAVVWDVDTMAHTVTVFRPNGPPGGTAYRPGDTADAEPAVPGWRMAVDDIFR